MDPERLEAIRDMVRNTYSDMEVVSRYAQIGLWPAEEILVLEYFPDDARVLDIGCGAGRTTIPLAEMGLEVVGIDFSPAMIQLAMELAAVSKVNPELQVMDVMDLKFSDDSFEIASRYTNEVFNFKWENSFCKARNACMDKSTCDWNFMTEGHEFLDPECLDEFKKIKEVEDHVSLLRVSRYISENNKTSSFPWLTRKGRGCHYVNDSHNAVISDIPKNNATKDFYEIRTIHKRSNERAFARKEQRFYMNRKNLLQVLLKFLNLSFQFHCTKQ